MKLSVCALYFDWWSSLCFLLYNLVRRFWCRLFVGFCACQYGEIWTNHMSLIFSTMWVICQHIVEVISLYILKRTHWSTNFKGMILNSCTKSSHVLSLRKWLPMIGRANGIAEIKTSHLEGKMPGLGVNGGVVTWVAIPGLTASDNHQKLFLTYSITSGA